MVGKKRQRKFDKECSVDSKSTTTSTTTSTTKKQKNSINTKATSTEKGYDRAHGCFNEFSSPKGIPKIDDLTEAYLEEYGVEKLLTEFSDYMLENVKKIGTSLQYLSGVKTYIMNTFSRLSCFDPKQLRNGNFKWYSDIRRKLKRRGYTKAHQQGVDVTDKPDAIGRSLLELMCKLLLESNTAETVFHATAMAILWSAIKRASELGLATWNTMRFDGKELDFMWRQKKTSTESPMRFPCDRYSFIICPFHSLGRYLILYRGSFILQDPSFSTESRWLFPKLVNRGDGDIARILTNELQKLAKANNIPQLKEMPKVKGFRNGATMALRGDSRIAGKFEANIRAGWSYEEAIKELYTEYHYIGDAENVTRSGEFIVLFKFFFYYFYCNN